MISIYANEKQHFVTRCINRVLLIGNISYGTLYFIEFQMNRIRYNMYNVTKMISELFKLYLEMAVPALSFKTLYRLVERT